VSRLRCAIDVFRGAYGNARENFTGCGIYIVKILLIPWRDILPADKVIELYDFGFNFCLQCSLP
jgi:hypothetical protein